MFTQQIFPQKIFTQKNFRKKNFFTESVRLSFVDLRWAQLYVSLVLFALVEMDFSTKPALM